MAGKGRGHVCILRKLCACVSDPLLAAAQHQEGFDVVLLQVGVPLAPVTRFHLVVPVQVLQRGLGDVDAPTHTHTDADGQLL